MIYNIGPVWILDVVVECYVTSRPKCEGADASTLLSMQYTEIFDQDWPEFLTTEYRGYRVTFWDTTASERIRRHHRYFVRSIFSNRMTWRLDKLVQRIVQSWNKWSEVAESEFLYPVFLIAKCMLKRYWKKIRNCYATPVDFWELAKDKRLFAYFCLLAFVHMLLQRKLRIIFRFRTQIQLMRFTANSLDTFRGNSSCMPEIAGSLSNLREYIYIYIGTFRVWCRE